MNTNLEELDFVKTEAVYKKAVIFLKEKLGIIKNTNKEEQDTKSIPYDQEKNLMECFEIKKIKDPIYLNINNKDMFQSMIIQINEYKDDLLEELNHFMEANENKIGDEVQQRLEMFFRLIEKFNKVLVARSKKINLDDFNTIGELQDQVYKFLEQMIKEYFIERIIDSIYAAINAQNISLNEIETYKLILKYCNKFLANLGIYTIKINEGDLNNFDLVLPTMDSSENITNEYKLKDCIKNVQRYPYFFEDERIVVEGLASIWRFEQ